MKINSLQFRCNQSEAVEIESIANEHELIVRVMYREPGNYKIMIEKNDPDQRLDHFLYSLGYRMDWDYSDVDFQDDSDEQMPDNILT